MPNARSLDERHRLFGYWSPKGAGCEGMQVHHTSPTELSNAALAVVVEVGLCLSLVLRPEA